MSDISTDQKKLLLQQISIAERADLNGLVLRAAINCDMNLKAVDVLIGELITWRDRLAAMKEKHNE